MRRTAILLALVLATGALAGCADQGEDGRDTETGDRERSEGTTYRVTIENQAEGQPLSPGVVVTHSDDMEMWEEGGSPSEGLVAIAEDGDPSAAVDSLEGAEGVHEVASTGGPIDRAGGEAEPPERRTITVNATDEAERLTVAVMLICTNDGFTGVSGMQLPDEGTTTENLSAYDAGSEENTEAFSDIVDPCQQIGPVSSEPDGNDNDLPEDGGTIQQHPGIEGGADLDPEAHGWTDDPATLTVETVE